MERFTHRLKPSSLAPAVIILLCLLSCVTLAGALPLENLEAACESGDGNSCLKAAAGYATGDKSTRNYVKARLLDEKACSLGIEKGCERASFMRRADLMLAAGFLIVLIGGCAIYCLRKKGPGPRSLAVVSAIAAVAITSIYALDLLHDVPFQIVLPVAIVGLMILAKFLPFSRKS